MFVDSQKKFIQMNDTGEAYTIKGDNNFWYFGKCCNTIKNALLN